MAYFQQYKDVKVFSWNTNLSFDSDLGVQCSLYYCSRREFLQQFPDFPYQDETKYTLAYYAAPGLYLPNNTRGYSFIQHKDGTNETLPVPSNLFETYVNWGVLQWTAAKNYIEQHYILPYNQGKSNQNDNN